MLEDLTIGSNFCQGIVGEKAELENAECRMRGFCHGFQRNAECRMQNAE
jgi:hypothetical protein